MKHWVSYVLYLSFVFGTWAALKYAVDSNHIDISSIVPSSVIDTFPWLLLMWLGCFCLGKLGLDIVCFNDMPQEIQKLEKEIVEAKADLKKKGFRG